MIIGSVARRSVMRRAAVAALVVAVALAGCIGGLSGASDDDLTSTEALDALRRLRDDGKGSSSETVAALVGVELHPPNTAVQEGLLGRIDDAAGPGRDLEVDDGDAGDGAAPHWLVLYGDERFDNASAAGLTKGDGGSELRSPAKHDVHWQDVYGGEPVGDGWMASDEAAKRAGEVSEAWARRARSDLWTGWSVLQRQPGMDNPYWLFTWPLDGLNGTVVVDAVTGDRRELDDVYPDVEPETGSRTVQLDPVEGDTIAFDVDGTQHGLVTVVVEPTDDPAPDLHVGAELTGPDGRPDRDIGEDWPEPLVMQLPAPADGPYRVDVSAQTGAFGVPAPATEEVEVAWCADGRMPDPLGLQARGTCLDG